MKWMSFLVILFCLNGCYENRERFGGSSISPISTNDVFEVTCTTLTAGEVTFTGGVFSPSTETIQQYDVVKWKNTDTAAHTVTSGTSSARSDIFDIVLSPGQERCLRFLRVRNYPYFDSLNTDIRGEISVR